MVCRFWYVLEYWVERLEPGIKSVRGGDDVRDLNRGRIICVSSVDPDSPGVEPLREVVL